MSDLSLKKFVIIGGGTAGWMSAAMLSKFMPNDVEVTLIESADIGTIGVGEATIPHLKNFNNMLGIDEATFLKETKATYKLGIEFADWGSLGERYIHPFGEYGIPMGELPFHHFWGRAKAAGDNADFGSYSLNVVAAKANKFMHPVDDRTSLASSIVYAYHLDAISYGKFLRKFAKGHGAKRIEGKVIDVNLAQESGIIESVTLQSGDVIEGDFFIDCTGFRALLIEGALQAGYEDWSDFLPMDRAVAIQTQTTEAPKPYTVATARKAGWTWRIPLQNRVGNGYVYSSQFMEKDEATDILMSAIEGEPMNEPKHLSFSTGRRKAFWKKNCLALGLSAGFMEPLESTSIHLVQDGLIRLMALMPDKTLNESNIREYNRVMGLTYERIRDFILLHYVVTERDDTPFWRHMRALEIPDIMRHRMELLHKGGHHVNYEHDLFKIDSWLAVMEGQGRGPEIYSPLADSLDEATFTQTMGQLRHAILEISQQMPTHQRYIQHVLQGS